MLVPPGWTFKNFGLSIPHFRIPKSNQSTLTFVTPTFNSSF